MITANPHYSELPESYLFVTIARKVEEFRKSHPDASLIRMGIGDVVLPLAPSVARAMSDAALAMATPEGFKGYGPEQGYAGLREKIAQVDFKSRGVNVEASEIFVSDGSKCDVGHFQELFGRGISIGIPDPVYPVYRDSNIMAGRKEYIVYLKGTGTGMIPSPPAGSLDLVYLCSPNNPTGAVMTKAELRGWVDWAKKNQALILFDAAYAEFIHDPNLPRSIYEIEGARSCAVEFRSLSKSAGFTGVRCAYTVVPRDLMVRGANGEAKLWDMWNRRQSTLFNGVSWPVQAAAEAVYSPQGQTETKAQVKIYQDNAAKIRAFFENAGFEVSGGADSPYVWVYTGGDSWATFDAILEKTAIVITPGSGFGTSGDGFIRVSAFQTPEKVEEALSRLKSAAFLSPPARR